MIAILLLAQLLAPAGPPAALRGPPSFSELTQPGSGSRAPFINVRAAPYFAVGDGVADDTAAIQAAITAAAGKTAFFPCGTYLHSQITISASNTSLVGASRKCVTLKANAASATGLFNLTSGPLADIVFRDLKLDANSKATAGGLPTYDSGATAPQFPAINLGTFNVGTDVTGLVIDGLDVTGFSEGLYVPFNAATRLHQSFVLNSTWTGLSPTTQKNHVGIRINADTTLVQGNYLTGWTNGINPVNAATQVKVVKNIILQPANGNDVGIYAASCAKCDLSENYIELASPSNAAADGCIKIGAAATTANDTHVHHNICNAGTIKLSGGNDVTIDHNRVISAQNIGCGQSICTTTENTNARAKIDSNEVTGGAGNCIQSRTTDSVTITNNTCDAPGGAGIDMRTATSGWVISGNRVRESVNHCIFVDGSTDGAITGNSCIHSATGATPGIRIGGSSSRVVVSANAVNGYARCVQQDTGTNADNVVAMNGCYGTTTAGTFADGSVTSGFVGWNYVNGGIADTVSLNTIVTARNMATLYSITQANLGTPANGTIVFCSDCTVANPCAAAGTGALAKRIAGAWVCN